MILDYFHPITYGVVWIVVFQHCKSRRKNKDALGVWLSIIIGKTLSGYFDLFAPAFEIFSVLWFLHSNGTSGLKPESCIAKG